jgi:hypothetical protein
MWPIQLAFIGFSVWMMFLSSLTLFNTFSFYTRSVQLTCSRGTHSTPHDDYISRTQCYRIGSVQASGVKYN